MKEVVLVIGNGFDLAHGLPTKYGQFLDFLDALKCYPNQEEERGEATELDASFAKLFESADSLATYKTVSDVWKSEHRNKLTDLCGLVSDNIWFKYFRIIHGLENLGTNWIDFEKEISLIIQSLDSQELSLNSETRTFFDMYSGKAKESKYSLEYRLGQFVWTLAEYDYKLKKANKNKLICPTLNDIRKRLFDDLERMIGALNIYLFEYASKTSLLQQVDIFQTLQPTRILSFNYTQTGEKIFPDAKRIYYIHGECSADINASHSNMVLGIDEYLDETSVDINTDYVIFKKYVQRIQKHTTLQLQALIDDLDASQCGAIANLGYGTHGGQYGLELHIYGHSLDITDKDILKRLFEMSFDKIIIYCYDKIAEGQYIANLIKIIGQKSLIERIENKNLIFNILN